MTLRDQSNIVERAEVKSFYTVLEYDFQGAWRMCLIIEQLARNEREAAERSAGVQLSTECRPRRIRVYREKPVDFEWVRVEDRLLVGDVQ